MLEPRGCEDEPVSQKPELAGCLAYLVTINELAMFRRAHINLLAAVGDPGHGMSELRVRLATFGVCDLSASLVNGVGSDVGFHGLVQVAGLPKHSISIRMTQATYYLPTGSLCSASMWPAISHAYTNLLP